MVRKSTSLCLAGTGCGSSRSGDAMCRALSISQRACATHAPIHGRRTAMRDETMQLFENIFPSKSSPDSSPQYTACELQGASIRWLYLLAQVSWVSCKGRAFIASEVIVPRGRKRPWHYNVVEQAEQAPEEWRSMLCFRWVHVSV